MGSRSKRALVEFLDGNDDDDKIYRFQILLPDGANTRLTLHDPGEEMSIGEFVDAIRKEIEKTPKSSAGPRRRIIWNGDIHLEDVHDNQIKKKIHFSRFKPNKCHILKLYDGAGPSVETFHNMWDLTPDTDLLQELPAEYNFETALADLIDNSLQAVWSNVVGERRLISITVDKEKIIIFDTGPGMDGSDENSISKWGKMGSSNHRCSRQIAIGGKAPYLMPFFGMFGYGGPVASMHLGRLAIVSSKTQTSKKVYTLHLSREALMKRSTGKCLWRADGGIRDPSVEEMNLSPHGSFTKVEISELQMRGIEVSELQCFLKDVYFPYIQCDEEQGSMKTTTPVEFQVNNTNLAEIEGGEVAVTNLHSCRGPEFVFHLHLRVNDDQSSKVPGSRNCLQANARLQCVYFPIVEGKEKIDVILEKLESDGHLGRKDSEKFSHVSIRRLGRLLPDARWQTLPFMEPHLKRGDKAHLLRRCCHRVKCFIDTDAGFKPTPSKTDLAHYDAFTLALRSFGNKPSSEESGKTIVEIRKNRKSMTLSRLEKEYHDWIVQMHEMYDGEAEGGEDEPVLVINPSNKKKLGINADVVRVHRVIRRKGLLWESGQKVKILKGAVGCWKNNIYATVEYFLLTGFQGDAGGEARLICRPLGCQDEQGCLLVVNDGNASLEINGSLSFPINEIDKGKIQQMDDSAWNYQLEKRKEKLPASIELLTSEQCRVLDLDGELPLQHEVDAGYDPPNEIVTVIRPSCYTSLSSSKGLDQKYILSSDLEMSMEVNLSSAGKEFKNRQLVFGQRVKPTSRNGFRGLYIFSLKNERVKLFCKAGVYKFSFFVACKDSACIKMEVSVSVVPTLSLEKWILHDEEGALSNRPVLAQAGYFISHLSLVCLDQFKNPVPLSILPEFKLNISADNLVIAQVQNLKTVLSSNQLSVEILDMLIESCNLDMVRPTYEATLRIYLPDESLMTEAPCRVMPGPPSSVKMKCSSELESHLSPGHVIGELILEVLDAYCNHVEEGVEILVQLDGLSFLDHMVSMRKVDNRGYIDLSGLVKVTADYASTVSLLVSVGEKSIFNKTFLVVEREVEVMPEVQAQVVQAPRSDLVSLSDPDSIIPSPQHSDNGFQPLQYSTMCSPSQISYLVQTIADDFGDRDKMREAALLVKQHEDKLKILEKEKEHIGRRMSYFQGKVEPEYLTYIESLTNSKVQVLRHIQGKKNNAAAVFCNLKAIQVNDSQTGFIQDFVGLVALLGTVRDRKHSGVFAEYLGKDYMLAVVFKSHEAVWDLEKYGEDGRMTRNSTLCEAAAALGITIDRRFSVICLEDVRPYKCLIKKRDPQRNLALPSPLLPSGKTPAGFLGYAVNMIDLDQGHLNTRTSAGYGLRETLFYSLFGETQVYETRENIWQAKACIKHGAISLDGGIMRNNGVIFLGKHDPPVRFPVAVPQASGRLPQHCISVLNQIGEIKARLASICDEINQVTEAHSKALARFEKKKEKWQKFLDKKSIAMGYLSQQSTECKPTKL